MFYLVFSKFLAMRNISLYSVYAGNCTSFSNTNQNSAHTYNEFSFASWVRIPDRVETSNKLRSDNFVAHTRSCTFFFFLCNQHLHMTCFTSHWPDFHWNVSKPWLQRVDLFENYAIVAMQSDNVTFLSFKIIKVTSGFNLKKTIFFHQVAPPSKKQLK